MSPSGTSLSPKHKLAHHNTAAEAGRAFHIYQHPSRLSEDASRESSEVTI